MEMKTHKVVSYEPTKKGYKSLYDDDITVANASRSLVMTYMKGWNHGVPECVESLQDVSNLAGFNITLNPRNIGNGQIRTNKKFPLSVDIEWYKMLFYRFKNEIDIIKKEKYDPNDEHGICDESVLVANLIYKYRHFIALRRVKKTFFGSVKCFIRNIFVKQR